MLLQPATAFSGVLKKSTQKPVWKQCQTVYLAQYTKRGLQKGEGINL
jgi:hypothetical protein